MGIRGGRNTGGWNIERATERDGTRQAWQVEKAWLSARILLVFRFFSPEYSVRFRFRLLEKGQENKFEEYDKNGEK